MKEETFSWWNMNASSENILYILNKVYKHMDGERINSIKMRKFINLWWWWWWWKSVCGVLLNGNHGLDYYRWNLWCFSLAGVSTQTVTKFNWINMICARPCYICFLFEIIFTTIIITITTASAIDLCVLSAGLLSLIYSFVVADTKLSNDKFAYDFRISIC